MHENYGTLTTDRSVAGRTNVVRYGSEGPDTIRGNGESGMRRRVLLILAVLSGITGMLVASGISIGPFNARAYLAYVPRVPIALCVLLIVATEIVKGLRWGTFLRASGVRIPFRDAISTSIASQTLAVMPAHDLLAARLVEEHSKGQYYPKMRQALPGLVARWIADAIALSIVATIGVAYYKSFTPYTLIPIPIAIGVAVAFRSKKPARWIVRRLARRPRTQKLVRSEADFHRAARHLMRPKPLAAGVFWSTCTTFLSATMLYVLTRGFGSTALSMPEALVAHSLTTLTAMISFIPSGFGVADGSLAAWMHFFGVGTGHIVLVATTMRLAGIVVRTALGTATLLTCYQDMWEGSPRLLVRRVFNSSPAFTPAAGSAPLGVLPVIAEPAEAI